MIFQEKFFYQGNASKVVFEAKSINQVKKEALALNAKKVLVISTAQQKKEAQMVEEVLEELFAGTFSEARMHTPVKTTQMALELVKEAEIDTVVAIGGGSATGLSKAIAFHTDLPQIVLPTTYAGSEATPILGQTENNKKTTLKSPKVLPEVIIYDVEFTYSLPIPLSVNSGMNAIAHAVEALYAENRNPITSIFALEGIQALAESLPEIVQNSQDFLARSKALYGAWLCGTVLGSVGMALHHKLCHTLGGMFDLPHAETHAVVLPYAIGYNELAVPELLKPLAEIFGTKTASLGIYQLAQKTQAASSLKDLGMPEDRIDDAVAAALQSPYWNPRELEKKALTDLITKAYHGDFSF